MPARKKSTATPAGEPRPNLGLTENAMSAVAELLNARLADTFILYTKTRNYHWNVKGKRFQPLHGFFEEQYDQLEEAMDEIAERVVQLGGVAAGTLAEFVRLSSLKEQPGVIPNSDGMLAQLLADHEAVIRQLRQDVDATAEKYGDAGTSDFLTGLMESHEKMAWMLRAFLAAD